MCALFLYLAIVSGGIDKVWGIISRLDFAWWDLVDHTIVVDGLCRRCLDSTIRIHFKDGHIWTVAMRELSSIHHKIIFEVIACEPEGLVSATVHSISLERVTLTAGETFIRWTTDFSSDATLEVVMDASFKRKEALQSLANSVVESKCPEFIPFKVRSGKRATHKQVLELSPSEESMVKVSLQLKGAMKTSVALIVDSSEVSDESLSSAVIALRSTNPALRCKVIPRDEKLHPDTSSTFVAEVDDEIEIPVVKHVTAAGSDIFQDWLNIWSQYIEKEPLKLGSSIAQINVVSNGGPISGKAFSSLVHTQIRFNN